MLIDLANAPPDAVPNLSELLWGVTGMDLALSLTPERAASKAVDWLRDNGQDVSGSIIVTGRRIIHGTLFTTIPVCWLEVPIVAD